MGDVRSLIAFDLDGTLIDSRRDLAESANQLIQELGGTELTEDAVGRMVGEGAALLVARALHASGLDHVRDALPRFLEIYDTRLLNHTRAYPGVHEALRIARRAARVTVLTNKPRRPTGRILEALQLDELVDEVAGGDGPYPRKPDPTGLLAMMAAAGATGERTLLVGDSAIDHETARRASARCCIVSYGFGYQHVLRDNLAGHEWLVDDAFGLAKVIEEFLASPSA